MKRSLLFSICIFYLINCFSQNRYKTWCFGDHAGLDFSTSPPTTLGNSAMYQEEGCASICDNNTGQLLFYSNGINIWNRNNQVMLNGSGLQAGPSSTQATLIVPKPGNSNIYYVFTTPEQGTVLTLRYSIVDMTLDGGLGAVTTKNVFLRSNMSEKITATLKNNGVDYWVVAKEFATNLFCSFSITAAGVNLNPVTSATGIALTDINDHIGYQRISHNGSKLCIAYFASYISQLFDFNNSTGTVSNPIDLVTPFVLRGPYGIEFSPDDSKLYITQMTDFVLRQYNLLAGSPAAIQNSVVDIVNLGATGLGGAIMLGPDGKMYITDYTNQALSVVNQPNLTGAACNFALHAITLSSGTSSKLGLPNNINYPITGVCPTTQNFGNSVTICTNQTYLLPWGVTVNAAGIYSDTIRNYLNTCDSIINTINLSVFPVSNVNTAAQICTNQTYQLPSGTIVNTAGVYLDTIRSVSSCDSVITTVNLSVFPVSNINTTVQVCTNQTYQLPSGVIVSTAGIYIDTVRSVSGCDSVITNLNLSVLPVSHLNTVVQLCSDEIYHLPSGAIINSSGIYLDTLRSVAGCDSIINTITVLINNVSSSNIVDSIYEGQSYILPSGQTVNTPGVYQTVLLNSLGCDSVITVTLKLRKQIAECLTLKNAFTPNGDGINDYWILYKYNCFKKLEVNVYNRYGSLVYHSDDYKNDWNGKYKNKELPDGTYYYVMKVIAYDGKDHVFKNNLTILR